MGKSNLFLLILALSGVFLVTAVVVLALSREALFWYWRSKGVVQSPQDMSHKNHETALIMKKSMEELKAEEMRKRSSEPPENG